MSKPTARLSIDLLLLLLGVLAAAVFLFNGGALPQKEDAASTIQERQKLRLIIPDEKWDRLVFGEINKRTQEADLPSLRTVLLSDDDLEVRVWISGEPGMTGLVLRRSANQWSAIHLPAMSGQRHLQSQEALAEPRSSWETAWKRLVSAEILSLPDASEVQCNVGIVDGGSYIVEINKDKTYRTYMYVGPKFAKCDEAKQMLTIGKIIAEEFSLEDFMIQ